MLVGTPDLIASARTWGLHGMNRDAWKRYGKEGPWFYEVVSPGFKYNMTDIQAALGLHQLRKLPQLHARRQAITRRYNAAFDGCEELQVPAERDGVEHAWHLYVLRLNLDCLTITRNQFISELGKRKEDFPVAYREYQRLVSLPLSPRMTDGDVADVIAAVKGAVKAHTARPKSGRGLSVVIS